MKFNCIIVSICVLAISCNSAKQESKINSKILIVGGQVFDGIQNLPQSLNILIEGDRISYVGNEEPTIDDSVVIIDAEGLVVTPGFIDPHTHALEDLDQLETSHNLPFLHQGITTVVTGSDGRSPIPITSSFNKWEENGIGTNALMLAGHGQIRLEVLGEEDRAPSTEELGEMKDLLRQAMKDGAFGLSTGLYYSPGFFAQTDEVVDLAKVAAEYGGIYDTHQRDESNYSIGLIASVEEVLEIGRQAKIPVHISHIKALGSELWGYSNQIINMVREAREAGIEVTANQYPYNASGTSLNAALLPRRLSAGGREELIGRLQDPNQIGDILIEVEENIRRRGGPASLIMISPINRLWKNKSLEQLSNEWRISPAEAAVKMVIEGGSGVASFNMTEEDIANFMKQDWVVTGSDGSRNHPRKYGTFPRKIYKYALQDSVISMDFAINQSTSRTARIFGIEERGEIREGYFADVVVFDPNTIKDKAWFNNPDEFSSGVEYVIVNGSLTIDKGNYLGNLAGRVLRKRVN